MARTKITKAVVDKLPPNTWLWCTALAGFGCRRQKDAIVYYLRWQQDGRQRMRALGRHGPLTPETARQKARQALGELAAGRDPFPVSGSLASDTNVEATFGGQVPRFLERQRTALKHRSLIEVTRHLMVHASPLNAKPLAKINRRDIAALLADVEAASGPYARNHVRASLSAFWTWAIAEGFVEANPVQGTVKAPAQSRDRVLTDAEIGLIWKALPVGDFGDIVRLLLLTGQREEIGALQWSEVDLADGVIMLPPARVKNGRSHQVPLSEPALAILAARHSKREGPAVFGRDGRDRFTNWSNTKAALDRKLGPSFRDWHLHDCRRTVASGMARLGINLPVIERVLNHVSGSFAGIVSVYQRHDFADEKRAALALWAKHVAEIVGPTTNKASPAIRHAQAINVG
jgi:integrase